MRAIRFPEQCQGPRLGDIQLFRIGSRKDEDCVARVIMWEGVDGALDSADVCLFIRSGDEDCVLWTAFKGVFWR